MKCKFNDCGWCYCQSGRSNDDCGQCNHHESCEEYLIQSDETKSLSVILGCINVMADDCLPSRTMVVSRDIFESVKKERSHD